MPTFLAHVPGGKCRRIIPEESPDEVGSLVISGSVGRNGKNRFEDVRTIQDALNQVPHGEGGPVPKLNVDGLCWGKTIAAIERFQRDACGFKWPDGRVEPLRRTHIRLQDFFLLPSPYTLTTIHLMLPQALSWIFRARNAVSSARHHLELGIGSREVVLLEKYFHLSKLQKPRRKEALDFVDRIYRTMEHVLNQSFPGRAGGAGYFVEDPKSNLSFAYTFEGGFQGGPVLSRSGGGYNRGPNVRIDRIYVCPRKLNAEPPEAYTVAIVHELAHFCGGPVHSADAVVDHGYRRQAGFFDLSPDQALHTADCYAHFAGHVVVNREPQHV